VVAISVSHPRTWYSCFYQIICKLQKDDPKSSKIRQIINRTVFRRRLVWLQGSERGSLTVALFSSTVPPRTFQQWRNRDFLKNSGSSPLISHLFPNKFPSSLLFLSSTFHLFFNILLDHLSDSSNTSPPLSTIMFAQSRAQDLHPHTTVYNSSHNELRLQPGYSSKKAWTGLNPRSSLIDWYRADRVWRAKKLGCNRAGYIWHVGAMF
jgi:hypothetical protein